MPTYWNFRKILDVHPEWDDRCVAIKVRSEERCNIRGKAGKANLTAAAHPLDTMDRTLSLSECCGHLDRLAYLTMCGNPHRNMTVVRADRCRRWNNEISAYMASNERKKANAQKSKEALKTRNAEEYITAKLGNEGGVQVV